MFSYQQNGTLIRVPVLDAQLVPEAWRTSFEFWTVRFCYIGQFFNRTDLRYILHLQEEEKIAWKLIICLFLKYLCKNKQANAFILKVLKTENLCFTKKQTVIKKWEILTFRYFFIFFSWSTTYIYKHFFFARIAGFLYFFLFF